MKALPFLIIWNCVLTGFLIYLLVLEFQTSSSSTETTRQITTLSSTLDAVQNNVVDLNQTATKTVESLTIGYNGNDVYLFIDIQGTNTLNGFLYQNSTADINITEAILGVNDTIANISQLYYQFEISELGCCSKVYISADLTNVCLLSQLTIPDTFGCSTIRLDCRYITLFTLDTDQYRKNKATIYLSYGSVCV